MRFDDDDIRVLYHCLETIVRPHLMAGHALPTRVARTRRKLDGAYREMSARGHQNSLAAQDSITMSSVQVAQLIGRNERWVRRHAQQLGGVQHGDRWRFPRHTVEHFTEEMKPVG